MGFEIVIVAWVTDGFHGSNISISHSGTKENLSLDFVMQ
jgi:hypothetical protein